MKRIKGTSTNLFFRHKHEPSSHKLWVNPDKSSCSDILIVIHCAQVVRCYLPGSTGEGYLMDFFHHSTPTSIWWFPQMGVPQNGWFLREIPLKWMIGGYPHLWKPPYVGCLKNTLDGPAKSESPVDGLSHDL